MKYIILSILFVVICISANAREPQKKSRKEIRAEKESKKKEKINKLLDSGNYIFEASHALPMGGSSIYLNHNYDVQIKGDSVFSYLPFYGVAYYVEYGGRDGGFQFNQQLKNYNTLKNKKGYLVEFEVKNKNDNLRYLFHISELGFSTLNINSTNRQSISYYGIIRKVTDE